MEEEKTGKGEDSVRGQDKGYQEKGQDTKNKEKTQEIEVFVLRLGHRAGRDKRITTHVGLVARAFGARGIFLSGDRDPQVEESLRDVVRRWGGDFLVEYRGDWRRVIREWPGIKVHLTMYGLPFEDRLKEIKGKVLVIVGAEKVPPEVYELADYNLAVGNQPHSEVGALAVFLYSLLGPGALYKEREGAEVRIVPSERGKRVVGNKKSLEDNNSDGDT